MASLLSISFLILEAEIQVVVAEEVSEKIQFPYFKSPEDDYIHISGSSLKKEGKLHFLKSSRGSLNIMEGEKNPTIRQFGEMLNLTFIVSRTCFM